MPCSRWIDKNVSEVTVVNSKGVIHLNSNEKKFLTIRVRFLEGVTSFGVRVRAACNGEVNLADLQVCVCVFILICRCVHMYMCAHACVGGGYILRSACACSVQRRGQYG